VVTGCIPRVQRFLFKPFNLTRRGASHELLRPDLPEITCQYSGMTKKRKTPIETARTTIARVKKEMEMPRLTESVRNDRRYQAALAAQKSDAMAP
jgi:hypothetical protein